MACKHRTDLTILQTKEICDYKDDYAKATKAIQLQNISHVNGERQLPDEQLETYYREKQIGLRLKYINLKRNNPESLNLPFWKKRSLCGSLL